MMTATRRTGQPANSWGSRFVRGSAGFLAAALLDLSRRPEADQAVAVTNCKDGSDKILIDVYFVRDKLQPIRDYFGVPVTINSGYLTESYNAKVGGAKASYHMKGQAFDIVMQGHTPLEIAQYAQSLAIPGINQYNTFVHVDSRHTKYWARNDNGKVTVKSGF